MSYESSDVTTGEYGETAMMDDEGANEEDIGCEASR